jgi:XTP/dITP diphosphohydrolase
MHNIVFATNNAHKMGEVSAILDSKFKLISLKEIGCFDDIPETMDTIEGNALQKATYVWEKYGYDCIADDTGLEVEALNGAPGVYSARYAGEDCIAENNIQKLLFELDGVTNRTARFKTVAALILDGQVHLFEGIINGQILTEKRGVDGFGYDPVFKPDTCEESFAEMATEQKNTISHRALAFRAFAEFMNR